MAGEMVERVARAIEEAQCPGREGPYSLYDYSRYGWPKPHRVRDFRKRGSRGECVFESDDAEAAEAEHDRLTRHHIAQAAIDAALAEEAKVEGRREGQRLKTFLDTGIPHFWCVEDYLYNRMPCVCCHTAKARLNYAAKDASDCALPIDGDTP